MRRQFTTLLAAVAAALFLSSTASAQAYYGYNPYTNRYYTGAYTYNPWAGGYVQAEQMYNPYFGTSTFAQQYYNPWTGRNGVTAYQYNPYTNTYQYRTWRGNRFGWWR